jgi:hypothetical protein
MFTVSGKRHNLQDISSRHAEAVASVEKSDNNEIPLANGEQ